jgi:hypothetical protein
MSDVFMLNRFPCRMVEIVGWVAGVDEKEKTQTIYCESAFSPSSREEGTDEEWTMAMEYISCP